MSKLVVCMPVEIKQLVIISALFVIVTIGRKGLINRFYFKQYHNENL